MTQKRSEIINLLKKGTCVIRFKTVGTKRPRVLRATLEKGVIPTIEGKIGGENKEVVTCWDIADKAWKSFRLDSLIDDVALDN